MNKIKDGHNVGLLHDLLTLDRDPGHLGHLEGVQGLVLGLELEQVQEPDPVRALFLGEEGLEVEVEVDFH